MTQINPKDTYYAHNPRGYEVNVPGHQIANLVKKDFIILGRVNRDGEKEPFDEPIAKTVVHRNLFSKAWGAQEEQLPIREEE